MSYQSDNYAGMTFIPPFDEGKNPQRAKRRSPRWAAAIALLAVYAAVAAAGVMCIHSVSGWLVIGLAPVLLADRLTFRVLSPNGPETRIMQLGIRASYLFLGVYGFDYFHDGHLSTAEMFFAGGALSLATFLLEYVIEWALWLAVLVRGTTPFHAKASPVNTTLLAVLIATPMVLLHPLMAVHPIRRAPAGTPAKLGFKYDEVTLTTRDGLSLAGWFVPADGARGTVVYCHGYGENRGQVLSVLKPIHEMSLNVLAFDFRGHGDSPSHTATFGHREVRDLEAACGLAKQRGGGKPVFIVGVSYGAAVTLQALPKLPEVAGVWVDSTFGRMERVLDRSFGFLPQVARGPLVSLGDTMIRWDCGFSASEINPIECLKQVKQTPIYFCHSEHDPLTDFAEGKAVYEAYAGPKEHYWISQPTTGELTKSAQRGYFRRMREFFEKRLEKL